VGQILERGNVCGAVPAGLLDGKPATMSVATDGHIQQRYRHTALIFVHM
jgi:hypothetical protein